MTPNEAHEEANEPVDGSRDSNEFDGHQETDLNTEFSADQLRDAEENLAAEFGRHRERLWQTVQVRLDPRLCGRIDPDDVLQEAFMDSVNRIPHFLRQNSYSPFVWLRLMVGQTLVNVHRRHFSAQKRNAAREVSATANGYRFALCTHVPRSPCAASGAMAWFRSR